MTRADLHLVDVHGGDRREGVQLFADLPDVMDVPTVAGRLGVTKPTVYEAIKSGALRAFHVGRAVRVTKLALLEFVGEEPAHV